MIDLRALADLVLPAIMAITVFGAPALYLYIVRRNRFDMRQLELSHDKRIADLTRERDVLAVKVEQMEPHLEFLRHLVASSGGALSEGQKVRVGQAKVDPKVIPVLEAAQDDGDDESERTAQSPRSIARNQG
jgi:hypothetical protein